MILHGFILVKIRYEGKAKPTSPKIFARFLFLIRGKASFSNVREVSSAGAVNGSDVC